MPDSVMDGNEAAARIAYQLSEIIAVYPITPASPMGEWCDQWVREGRTNLWGDVPRVVEMQSEAGAAGAVHGSLQTGGLATTFTASQGLLLMLPNMFKIAGELSPTVIHVASRTVATHALSIFGDHSDVMAARSTGFALLASGSVQEAHDLALVSHGATLEGRVPVLHFFDGFRISHELARISTVEPDVVAALVSTDAVAAHRARALTPDRPVLRGTAQNPDVFFQAREACNPFYAAFPGVVQRTMDRLHQLTGRAYHLFEYHGAPEARQVLVVMGAGAGTAVEVVEERARRGAPVGMVQVRLYRPFDVASFARVLPPSVETLGVLDRTKEPGAPGEPLYLDVAAAVQEACASGERRVPRVVGGRYGLSSKEFTPEMVGSVLDSLRDSPRHGFTVGIRDDVSHTELPPAAGAPPSRDPEELRAVFFGLGSDGTVGASKSTAKILGETTDRDVQAYFVYDSKKAGSVTVSHLKLARSKIRSHTLIPENSAQFVACHAEQLLEQQDVLSLAAPRATFLLNTRRSDAELHATLPAEVWRQVREKELRFHAVDASRIAGESGLGGRINTIMQMCFFALVDVLPLEVARQKVQETIEQAYGKRGAEVVRANLAGVDVAVAHLRAVAVDATGGNGVALPPRVPEEAPAFVREVTARLLEGKGDLLPVSALPADGTFPTDTARWEKRRIAAEIPVWDEEICIQCARCTLVCPHAAIRLKVYDPALREGSNLKAIPWKGEAYDGLDLTIQVAPEDCTGCELCVHVCPARDRKEPRRKALRMEPLGGLLEGERDNYRRFLELPEMDRRRVAADTVKGSQLLRPLFEYSGACAGCGETPYLKLLSQLCGDRLVVANATGCSSIYGGNLPTTPWARDGNGRGPAWSNSLFEDAAEFGLGFRLALDHQAGMAARRLQELAARVGPELVQETLTCRPVEEADFHEQRERVAEIRRRLAACAGPDARQLEELLDHLVPKSVWVVGGDGWAYDIGFGGLDHVLASGQNVKILVLDTEVYSNTGGQMSKATPRAAVSKFAAGGKQSPKKNLGLIAMSYQSVYVAEVAMGASDRQTVQAFVEAERYPGPALILAYSHCIAHGIPMAEGMDHQKTAVKTGHWFLYRYRPDAPAGQAPLHLDSPAPRVPYEEFLRQEARFQMLVRSDPDRARELGKLAKGDIERRWQLLNYLASYGDGGKEQS